MAFRYVLVLLFASVTLLNFKEAQGNCWKTWSRCSRWSSWGTGRLWKTCNDRCIELGYPGGSCQLCPSTCWMTKKAYQCRCFGTGSC
ncbi:neuromacin-like protein [Stylophora pistillata]|uniref:neuromacin-like protein n=1 Tax=Stylophora pistillata TaxID=50429 RepID=UPI000C047B3D|nr:neuromacin-like protein [Stylophora pistillata]